jgi:hypothetical protein
MSWPASRMMVVANGFQGDAENPQAHVVLHTSLESTWFDGAVHVGVVGADRRVRPLYVAMERGAGLRSAPGSVDDRQVVGSRHLVLVPASVPRTVTWATRDRAPAVQGRGSDTGPVYATVRVHGGVPCLGSSPTDGWGSMSAKHSWTSRCCQTTRRFGSATTQPGDRSCWSGSARRPRRVSCWKRLAATTSG